MEDEQILDLYFSRSEQAIGETAVKYGAYCHSIAFHVLENKEDAEECVSDTWFSAWNTIPQNAPYPFLPIWGGSPGVFPLTAGAEHGPLSGAAVRWRWRWKN